MDIKTIHGSGIKNHLMDIAELRIEVFRDFPYLYDGSLEYEMNYLETYINSPESIAVLVFDDKKVVGVSTGIPMSHETEEFKKPLIDAGFDINKIFYCGESILSEKYRGMGLYSTFFKEREQHAKSLKRFEKICFCAVIRPDDHPLRPKNYKPLDEIWKRYGYKKHDDLKAKLAWKDINEESESDKELVYWFKTVR